MSLIGDEPMVPYDRPPLSKQFLAGQWDAAQLALRSHDQLETLDLELDWVFRRTGWMMPTVRSCFRRLGGLL